MNQELYKQFLDAAAVVVGLRKFSDAIDAQNNIIRNNELNVYEAEKNVKKSGGSYGKWKGWGIALMIIGFGNVALFAISILKVLAETAGTPSAPSASDLAGFAVILVFVAIFIVVGFIGLRLIGAARKRRKKATAKAAQECEEFKKAAQVKINKANDELAKIDRALGKFIQENDHYFHFLPQQYRKETAISFMLKAVENLRADTLKEAINLYEQELHLLEQERILQNNAEMQRLHNERMQYMMDSINRNQQQINSNLQFIQTMQIIDWLTD